MNKLPQAGISRRMAVTSLLTASALAPVTAHSRADASPGRIIRAADFGLVADGNTDDAPALLKAVAAMSHGSVLVLPPGTIALGSAGWRGVLFEGLFNIQILGEGTTLKWLALPSLATGPFRCTAFVLRNCRNASVDDLRIDGNGIDCIGFGLDTCSHCTVLRVEAFAHGATATGKAGTGLGQVVSCRGTNNSWLYCHVHHSTPTSEFRGFYLGNANPGWSETDLRVHGCSATHNDATGFALGGSGLICTSCLSEDNAGAGFISGTANGSPCMDHLFVGNVARRNEFHGWQTDVWGPPAKRICLNGNVFAGNVHCGVLCNKGSGISIIGNTFIDNGSSTGAGAIGILNSSGVIISENMIEGDSVHGICIDSSKAPNITQDVLITKNLCTGSKSKTLWLEAPNEHSSLRRIVIDGNILTSGSHGLYLSSQGSGLIEDITVVNNIASGATVADYWIGTTLASPAGRVRFLENSGKRADTVTPAAADPLKNSVAHGATPPNSGSWPRGAIVFNTAPQRGSPVGWVCVAEGSPGDWLSFGTIGN